MDDYIKKIYINKIRKLKIMKTTANSLNSRMTEYFNFYVYFQRIRQEEIVDKFKKNFHLNQKEVEYVLIVCKYKYLTTESVGRLKKREVLTKLDWASEKALNSTKHFSKDIYLDIIKLSKDYRCSEVREILQQRHGVSPTPQYISSIIQNYRIKMNKGIKKR